MRLISAQRAYNDFHEEGRREKARAKRQALTDGKV